MQWIRTVAEMCQTGIEHQNKEIKGIQQHMTIVSDSTSKSIVGGLKIHIIIYIIIIIMYKLWVLLVNRYASMCHMVVGW